MPEGYTHVRTARKAAETIHYKIQCPAAFAAGANGPDSFFCFEIWKSAPNAAMTCPASAAACTRKRPARSCAVFAPTSRPARRSSTRSAF
ncbi:hypothetical protein NIA69_05765 [Gemmiger formicilis]|nr:hypothetical protein [Gemmiger formicilis]